MSDATKLALARGALLLALLIGWELFGRLVDSTWTSQPSDVVAQIATWAADGLAWHIAVTLTEMAIGLAIGVPGGILLGLWLGRSPRTAGLLYPFIVVLNSVPVVALAVVMGVFPNLFLKPMAPSIERMLTQVRRGTQIRVQAAPARPSPDLLLSGVQTTTGVRR